MVLMASDRALAAVRQRVASSGGIRPSAKLSTLAWHTRLKRLEQRFGLVELDQKTRVFASLHFIRHESRPSVVTCQRNMKNALARKPRKRLHLRLAIRPQPS